eukprot:TRINITY_DN7794_c2_g1_i1.p1 TRINITY_DN7794_c2_g1~~TRINITY_DN7794_c2_g1_i1.p1  ORF type:complete len:612 (+),score=62.74 TRINITY_DN7794_c2_g1_i1:46-1881(+)
MPRIVPINEEEEEVKDVNERIAAFSTKKVTKLCLKWDELCFDVPMGKDEPPKRILNNLHGAVKPGELTAIMGPSGAGKSTFMNVLAGRSPYGTRSGTIQVNSFDVDPSQYRENIAYIMQRDALFATQTPRECLQFTASLRLLDLTQTERDSVVNGAITALGLERCADTLIGSDLMPGLSGGEMKRAAVAVELISSPSLIFLDEPTSGLDSHNACELIKTLRALAEAGTTIVCTIHQPSSEVFELFHRVMFLRQGELVYNGPVDGIIPHFAAHGHACKPNYNPSDFAMFKLQTLSDNEMGPLVASVARPVVNWEEIQCTASVDSILTRRAGFAKQLPLLLKREWFQFFRDKMTLTSRFGMSFFLALIIGLIYMDVGDKWGDRDTGRNTTKDVNNHWGALVFFAINGMFLSAQPQLLVFPMERPVFIREYTVGTYGTAAYFIAKTCVDIPASFVQQLLSTVVMYFIIDLQGNFILIVLSLTLLSAVSASTALLLGASTSRVEMAMNLMPAVYVPQIMFAGFFISSDSIPVFMRWIQWVCPLKYSVALVSIVEFAEKNLPDNHTFASEATSNLIKNSNINRDDWPLYTLIMVAIFCVFRITSAVILSTKAKTFQ